MLYALLCTDKPGQLALRQQTRPAHVAWLEALDADGRLKLAGPFLDADGNADGSLVVVEAPDAEAARALAEADPYHLAGLFSAVDIRPFNWVFKRPEV